LTLAAIVAAALAMPVTAAAQPGHTPPGKPATGEPSPGEQPLASPLDTHRGLMIGFSLGAGTVAPTDCQRCDIPRGMAVDAWVGWFLRPRLALLYDVFVVLIADAEEGYSAGNVVASLGAQYWVTPTIWVKGGVGMAELVVATYVGEGKTRGPGVTAGAGLELLRKGRFAIDIEARVSHGDFDGHGLTNFGVLLGANWH
jgi:hypothetical protein